jgi:hypothetical protein
MSQETSLRDLILGYYKQVGGLVEPPAYGIYEILLPDEVAARWGVSAHQRLIFAGERDAPGGELETAQAAGVILLHYRKSPEPAECQVISPAKRGRTTAPVSLRVL